MGAQAPYRSTRLPRPCVVVKKGASKGDVGNADGQRPLAASAVVAVGSADAKTDRERPGRGAVPPRTSREGFVEEANEKERGTAARAALAAPTSQQKKPRASGGGREARKPVRARKAKTLPSTDDVAHEGFETLDQCGKKAKRSATKADLASSDAWKLPRASEAATRPDRPVDRAKHAYDGTRACTDMNRAIGLADAPLPSSPLADVGCGSSMLVEAPNRSSPLA